MRTLACVCSVALLALVAFGCGGPAKQGGSSKAGAGASETLKISTANLPKLGPAISPIDEGRLEIAPPDTWHVPPRSSKWLARFQAEPGSPYPMIFVTAENSETLFHVTKDNVNELAEQVRKELRADSDTKRLAEGVQPATIGDFRGVLYRRWGKSSGWVMERWMLETVANGRRYTFELRCREGSADAFRPHLFAVASGLKFPKGSAAGSVLTAVEETPDEEPATDAAAETPSDDDAATPDDTTPDDTKPDDAKDDDTKDDAKAP